jgi:hypothetical protein
MDHKSSCSQKREAALHQMSDAAATPNSEFIEMLKAP